MSENKKVTVPVGTPKEPCSLDGCALSGATIKAGFSRVARLGPSLNPDRPVYSSGQVVNTRQDTLTSIVGIPR